MIQIAKPVLDERKQQEIEAMDLSFIEPGDADLLFDSFTLEFSR